MFNTHEISVVFSNRAYVGIVAETYERGGTETGGIFLGKMQNNVFYILETLDPGPNSTFLPAYFEYDTPYVTHLANKVNRFYKNGIDLVGLWHRHPGNFSSFSSTDDGTNAKYAQLSNEGAISALVNLTPEFQLTVYHVLLPLKYTKVKYFVDDGLIPEDIKRRKAPEDFIRSAGASQVQITRISPTDYPKKIEKIPQKTRRTPRKFSIFEIIFWPFTLFRRQRPNMERGGKNTPVSTEASSEDLLDMVESELNYLSNQLDYDYTIKLQGNDLLISLEYKQAMIQYPPRLKFRIGINSRGGYVWIDRDRHRYAPNFIRDYIEKQISLSKEMG